MLLRINSFYIPSTNVSSQKNNVRKPCRTSSSSSFYDHYRNSQSSTTTTSRTQRKLWLQRQSFLADDKNYLDHPTNMKRLTKELDRVNREYRCLLQYQDPLMNSIKRITTTIPLLVPPQLQTPSTSSSLSSSPSSLSYLSPSIRTHHKSLVTRLQQCHHA